MPTVSSSRGLSIWSVCSCATTVLARSKCPSTHNFLLSSSAPCRIRYTLESVEAPRTSLVTMLTSYGISSAQVNTLELRWNCHSRRYVYSQEVFLQSKHISNVPELLKMLLKIANFRQFLVKIFPFLFRVRRSAFFTHQLKRGNLAKPFTVDLHPSTMLLQKVSKGTTALAYLELRIIAILSMVYGRVV